MLILSSGIGAKIGEAFISLFLMIDGLLYSLVGYCFQIFLLLAKINVFKVSDYQSLVNRVYVVIGVVMLFVLTYTLLKGIVNPDEAIKGDKSPTKIITNVVTSLAILILLPSIFSLGAQLQDVIINSNVIGKIILGNSGNDTSSEDPNNLKQEGVYISYELFTAFFQPNQQYCTADDTTLSTSCQTSSTDSTDTSFDWSCACSIAPDDTYTVYNKNASGKYTSKKITNLSEAYNYVLTTGDFNAFKNFAPQVQDSKISYIFIISGLAAIALCYIVISFCFDLGIRVVKLAFLEIIAPLPVISRLFPGKNDMFNKWIKMLVATWAEVFIRLASMFFGVYFITLFLRSGIMATINQTASKMDASFMVPLFVKIFIILGIIAFVKQLPKLISDITGIDSGNMKLGIKDKLAAGGAFAVGAGVGALGMSSLNSLNTAKNLWKDGKRGKALFTPIAKLPKVFSSTIHGISNAKGAKSWKESGAAIKSGVATGMSSENFLKKMGASAADTYHSAVNIATADYQPYNSPRELEKANKYDALAKRHDNIMSILDKDKNIQAIDSFYSRKVETASSVAEAQSLQKAWKDQKDAARVQVYNAKMDKSGDSYDLELATQVKSYGYEISQNSDIIKEAKVANNDLAGAETFNANKVVTDMNSSNVTADMFKSFDSIGKQSSKMSVDIHNRAIEQQKKSEPKGGK